MKRLTWWFRVVGIFYLLLTIMNLWGLFFSDGQLLNDTLPGQMKDSPFAARAFMDAWMVFVFELGVLGAMALYAAQNAVQNRVLAWTIIWAEVFRGIVADAIWITRGYSAAGYAVFILIHLVIVVSGVMFLWQARSSAG